MLKTGYQPFLRIMICGDAETKSVFHSQLYELSEQKSGPVRVDFFNDKNEVEGSALTRMEPNRSDYYYSEWMDRNQVLIHLVYVSEPLCTLFKYNLERTLKESPFQKHVICFLNTSPNQTSEYENYFQSIGLNSVFYCKDYASIIEMLQTVGKDYNKAFDINPQIKLPPVAPRYYRDWYGNTKNRYDFPDYLDKLPLWKGGFEVLSPIKLTHAIESNSYEVVKNNLIALTEDMRYRWDYDEQDFINYCHQAVQEHHIDILLLLYTYLPDLGISLPQPTPLEFVKYIQTEIDNRDDKYKDTFKLSEEDEQKLKNFKPELVKQGIVTISDPYSKLPPYFEALNKGSFTLKQQRAYAYAKLIQKIQEFLIWLFEKNELQMIPIAEKDQDPYFGRTRLVKQLTYPYIANKIPNKRVTRDNFPDSLVYKYLVQAVVDNNERLAKKCLDIFRNNKIPLDVVLNYSNPLLSLEPNKNDDYEDSLSVLQHLFSKTSLSVLHLLCGQEDTLLVVQNHIILHKVIETALEQHRGQLSDLLFMILTKPEQALTLLNSVEALSIIGYKDIYSGLGLGFERIRAALEYNGDISNFILDKGYEVLRPLDFLLGTIFTYSPNMKKLLSNLGLFYDIAEFIRETLPSSNLLQHLYLPLAASEKLALREKLRPIQDSKQALKFSEKELHGVKYLFDDLQLKRNYKLYSKRTGRPFYLRLFPHGVISIAEQEEALEIIEDSNNEIHEKSKGLVSYSSKKINFKYPTGSSVKFTPGIVSRMSFFNDHALQTSVPEVPSQTPNILSSGGKRYIPISLKSSVYNEETQKYITKEHGFLGYFKTYGESSNTTPLDEYKAAIAGGCIVGATFYGQMIDKATGKVIKSIRLTHPDEKIPDGFRLDKLYCPFKAHLYEKYNFAMLHETIPILKRTLRSNAPIYYDLPTNNYILYGIQYYLKGVFTEDQLLQYIETIKEHHQLNRQQLDLIEQEYEVKIINRSTLDPLGLTEMPGDEILKLVHDLIPEINHSNYKTTANNLAQSIIQKLAANEGNIGIIYRDLPTDFAPKDEDPLMALNRFDYAALYALVKLDCADEDHTSPGDYDVLGFMPQDEVHIFQSYAKWFAKQYGNLDAIDWVPTILPQQQDNKESTQESKSYASKLFYVEDGIDELNNLIDAGLVSMQSLLISAIKNNNPQLYLSCLQQIIDCLSKAEEVYSYKYVYH